MWSRPVSAVSGQPVRRLVRTLIHPPWRDPLNALLFFAFGLLYRAIGLDQSAWSDPRDPPLWEYLLLLTIACGAVVFRSRAPRAALRVGLAVFVASFFIGTSLPLVLILADLLYSSVLYGPRRHSRVLVGVIAVMGAIAIVTSFFVAKDVRTAVTILLAFATLPVIPVWWAMQVRLNRERAEEARRSAVVAERARMARDLHDVVAGHLSAIALQSEAALAMSYDTVSEDVLRTGGILRSIRENSLQALTEMRAMIGLLKGDEADLRTAPPRLRELEPLIESARAGGVELTVEVDELPALPAAVELAAYRIVQEALTNVVKHASGMEARLAVGRRDGVVALDIENRMVEDSSVPGSGPGGDRGTATGLVSMEERARAVGGTLTAGRDNGRWVVRAELPTRTDE